MYILLLLDEIVDIHLTDAVLKFSDALTDFLLTASVHFDERGIQVSNYDSRFNYFSL